MLLSLESGVYIVTGDLSILSINMKLPKDEGDLDANQHMVCNTHRLFFQRRGLFVQMSFCASEQKFDSPCNFFFNAFAMADLANLCIDTLGRCNGL